jgi:hypothetical protein
MKRAVVLSQFRREGEEASKNYRGPAVRKWVHGPFTLHMFLSPSVLLTLTLSEQTQLILLLTVFPV